jgi:hypothetical protein
VWNVVFDLRTERFIHLDHADELPVHQIPLRRLKDPADYFRKLAAIDDARLKHTADLLFNRFKDYQLPLVTLGDMSIKDVAPVFERINSTGTRLTIYDLMRAATWSPDFDLGTTIDGIKRSLESKRFHTFDNKTFLRSLGAASGGDFSSGSIDALRAFDHDGLASAAESVKSAAQLAADFLSTEIGVPRAEALPYANQFAALIELFRVLPRPDSRRLESIRRWFWLTTLSGYFGGWDSGQMAKDTENIRSFGAGRADALAVSAALPNRSLWLAKPFRTNSAVSKMLAIMFGHSNPLDLRTGQRIDVDKSLAWSNDKEFHHFFPQAHLGRRGVKARESNVVGNIILLTSVSNIAISDLSPSTYLSEIIADCGREELVRRLQTNLVPAAALIPALADDYGEFMELRSQHLHTMAETLAGIGPGEPHEASPDEIDDTDRDPTE